MSHYEPLCIAWLNLVSHVSLWLNAMIHKNSWELSHWEISSKQERAIWRKSARENVFSICVCSCHAGPAAPVQWSKLWLLKPICVLIIDFVEISCYDNKKSFAKR